MIRILACTLILCASFQNIFASWEDLLQNHRTTMGEETYDLLSRQQQAYAQNQLPPIADQRVKSIEIIENDEPTVDIATLNRSDVSIMAEDELLRAHELPSDIDPRSARFGEARQSVFEALVRMGKEVNMLAPTFGYQAGTLGIKLFEGLRDLTTQKELFDGKKAELLAAHPEMTEDQAYAEASKWVSPYINNVPAHSTGAAVDIALFNNVTKTFCDMGRFNKSGDIALTFSEDPRLTEQQLKTRLLFLIAATRAGLTNYPFEFWHYSLGDRYAVYWRDQDVKARYAPYGSIK